MQKLVAYKQEICQWNAGQLQKNEAVPGWLK